MKPSNIESSSETRKDKSADPSAVPNAPRAVFFDAAGTLLRLRHPVGTQYAKIAAQFNLTLDPQALESAFQQQWQLMPPQNPGAPIPDDGKAWWRQLAFATLDSLDLPEPVATPTRNDWFEGLYAFYAQPRAWTPYPDVIDTLTHLSRLPDLTLGIISNWDGRLRTVLDGHQLSPFFDHITISSELGYSKPHPEIFHTTCRLAGVAPEDSLHVGDHPLHDWKGAADARLQIFPLDRSTRDLTELIETLPGT
ncbi:MAG: HAD-IA family hydrolase [Verrucomicrobiota bacterium]